MKSLKTAVASIAFISLILLSTVTRAYNTHYEQGYQPVSDPIETIQGALDKLRTFSQDNQDIEPATLNRFIETEIIPHFAFDLMTWWIAGPYARSMSPVDLDDLERRVRQTFLQSLATHLGSYDAERTQIRFRGPMYRAPGEATVSAYVSRSDAPPARLEFRMRLQGYDWKIIDVKANGTSAVVYYRNYFLSELRHRQYQAPSYPR